jgi:formylglycine-generating enzyme required for sulfatase activity
MGRLSIIFLISILQTFPAYGEEATVVMPGGVTMEFVWIEPGSFEMGAHPDDPHAHEWEFPRHTVVITRGFWIGKYEVTQQQWESVMGTKPWSGRNNVREGPNFAASYLTANDLLAFIEVTCPH